MSTSHPARAGFTILIDGLCPLCKKEAQFMRWLDGGRGRLAIVDIAEPGFDAARYGKTMDDVMGSIHGVTDAGQVISGMDVFRRAYRAAGAGWMMGWTGWPGLRPIVDRAYVWFAKNRLKLTGRHGAACVDGRCKLPA